MREAASLFVTVAECFKLHLATLNGTIWAYEVVVVARSGVLPIATLRASKLCRCVSSSCGDSHANFLLLNYLPPLVRLITSCTATCHDLVSIRPRLGVMTDCARTSGPKVAAAR